MLNATPQYAILAFLAAHKFGWHPQVYVSSVSISPNVMDIVRASAAELTNGSLSIAFVKDPTDQVWAKDPTVKLYRQILRRYAPGREAEDVYNFYGMGVAFTMVDALKHAGKSPTRASLLRAAQHLDQRANPFLLPGIAAADDEDALLPARRGLPLPVRQPPVGEVEFAPRRRAGSSPWHRHTPNSGEPRMSKTIR